jgi:signal transduction histidine kinase
MELPEQIQIIALLMALVGISITIVLLVLCWSDQRQVYRLLRIQRWKICNGVKYYRQTGRLLPTRWRIAGKVGEDIHPQDQQLLAYCRQDWDQGRNRGCILRMRNPQTAEYQHYVVRGIAQRDGYTGFLWSTDDILKESESADRLDRLAIVGRMTTTVVHDVNNQLGTIKAVMGVLGTPMEEGQRQRMVDHVKNAVEVGEHLSRNLMNFVREGQISPKAGPVDTTKLLHDTVDMLRMGLGRNISLDVQPAATRDTVLATAEELRSVLVNLVLNAKDAMPQGGSITVGSLNREEYGKSVLVLQVTDTGEGIDEAKQQELFLPFYTSKPMGKGLGLGLMACKQTVERYGGHVQVHSKVGEGTTFELVFPLEIEGARSEWSLEGDAAVSCL